MSSPVLRWPSIERIGIPSFRHMKMRRELLKQKPDLRSSPSLRSRAQSKAHVLSPQSATLDAEPCDMESGLIARNATGIGSVGVHNDELISKYGLILGAADYAVPSHLVLGQDSETVQTDPILVAWPNVGTGQGPQPFFARFPSGALRGITASLRGGQVEFSLPGELLDPDCDPTPGLPIRFELFQAAPHPFDRQSDVPSDVPIAHARVESTPAPAG